MLRLGFIYASKQYTLCTLYAETPYTHHRRLHLAHQHSAGFIVLVGAIQYSSSKMSTEIPSPPTKAIHPSRLAHSTCTLSSLPGSRKTTPKYYLACADGRIGLRDAVPRSVSAPIPAVAGAESPYGTVGRHISSLLLRMSPVVCWPDMRRAGRLICPVH